MVDHVTHLHTFIMTLVGKSRSVRFTLLPPPSDRSDLMAVVDVAKCAEIILLVVPGGGEHHHENECIDEKGRSVSGWMC